MTDRVCPQPGAGVHPATERPMEADGTSSEQIRLLLRSEPKMDPHRTQRARVIASLIALPGTRKPMHRRSTGAASPSRY
jgi:hypothetical protein